MDFATHTIQPSTVKFSVERFSINTNIMLEVFPPNNVLKNRGITLILGRPVKIGTPGFPWSALHSNSHIHRGISMGMYCMRESKQANNSYHRDE